MVFCVPCRKGRFLSNNAHFQLVPSLHAHRWDQLYSTPLQRSLMAVPRINSNSPRVRQGHSHVTGNSTTFVRPYLSQTRQLEVTNIFLRYFCLVLCAVVDLWFYGRPTLTPFNFLYFNVFRGIAASFGTLPFYAYFLAFVPFLMVALLPFLLYGVWLILRPAHATPAAEATLVTLATMVAFSCLGHKEYRFLGPLLPIFHCVTAYGLVTVSAASSQTSAYSWLPSVRKHYVQLILMGNVPVTLFCILIHQRGTIPLAHFVRNLPKGEVQSLGMAMPCYASPWQSYIHRPEFELEGVPSGYGGRLWSTTCNPPLK